MSWWSRAVAEGLLLRQLRQRALDCARSARSVYFSSASRDVDVVVVGGGHAGKCSGALCRIPFTA